MNLWIRITRIRGRHSYSPGRIVMRNGSWSNIPRRESRNSISEEERRGEKTGPSPHRPRRESPEHPVAYGSIGSRVTETDRPLSTCGDHEFCLDLLYRGPHQPRF